MSKKKSSSPRRTSPAGRFTEIGGVRVELAPAKKLLPAGKVAQIRRAVRDFYADKKAG
jgi:hypothetical protein